MKLFFSRILCTALTGCLFLLPTLPVVAQTPYERMPPVSEALYTNVIDVSHYEAVSDWAVLRQNTSILYAKATEGTTYTDPTMKKWADGAKENGLDFGFYHYFHPSTTANALAQADYFCQTIAAYSYTCLPVIDVEETGGQTKAQITAAVNAFRARVQERTGQVCMLYVSAGRIDDFFTAALLTAPLWVADYASPYASGPRKMSTRFAAFTMWQYTETGTHPGIVGQVDLNKATAGVLLSHANTPAVPNYADYYPVASLPQASNSTAGTVFYARDRYGNRLGQHQVDPGDPLIILGVDYATQLAEVLYPNYAANGWFHGYITNAQNALHNTGYQKWQNGNTNTPVYDQKGTRIGTIFPREKATILGQNGRLHLLYATDKGPETKSGYVDFAGGQK